LTLRWSVRSGSLRSRSLETFVRVNRRATLTLTLVARLHGRLATVGRARAVGSTPGRRVRVLIPFTPRARRGFRGLRRLEVAFAVTARDATGQSAGGGQRIVLTR